MNRYSFKIRDQVKSNIKDGILYIDLDELGKAEQCFIKALELTANNQEVNFYLGFIYFKSDKNDLAEKHFMQAIKIKKIVTLPI